LFHCLFGSISFLSGSFVFSLSLVSHVVSLTAPETEQVLVCRVSLALLSLISALACICSFRFAWVRSERSWGDNTGEAAKAGKYRRDKGLWTFRMISAPRGIILDLDTSAAQANEQ
jgi:hypothetical protein